MAVLSINSASTAEIDDMFDGASLKYFSLDVDTLDNVERVLQ